MTVARPKVGARRRALPGGAAGKLCLAPVGETMFPQRTPFFQRPFLLGEPPGSAQAGSVAGQAGDARPANRGACGAPRPLPAHGPEAGP